MKVIQTVFQHGDSTRFTAILRDSHDQHYRGEHEFHSYEELSKWAEKEGLTIRNIVRDKSDYAEYREGGFPAV